MKKTREHLTTMGETGAGITSEDQINMDDDNEFMNKWSEYCTPFSYLSVAVSCSYHFLELIKDSFPWLWEMKDLISERPNVTPVGLGNSESMFDMSGYDAGYKTDDDDLKPASDEDDDDDDDDDDDMVTVPCKRLAGSSSKKKVTQAQKMKTPKADAPRNKKSKVLDRFADLASAEEVTNQMELDLKKARMENASAKIKAKAEIQIQRDKLKAEMRMLQKKQDHNYRMARLNLQLVQRQGGTLSSLSAGFYSASPNPSVVASALFNADKCSQSPASSFDTGLSSPFDLDNFEYDTSLSSPHLSTPN